MYLKKIEENDVNGLLLSQHPRITPSIVGVGSMKHCMRLGGVIPLVAPTAKLQKLQISYNI